MLCSNYKHPLISELSPQYSHLLSTFLNLGLQTYEHEFVLVVKRNDGLHSVHLVGFSEHLVHLLSHFTHLLFASLKKPSEQFSTHNPYSSINESLHYIHLHLLLF